MVYGVTAWPCGGEEGMGREPPLIPNKYRKPLPTMPPSNLFFSGLAPAHPLQMIHCSDMVLLEKAEMALGKKVGGPVFFHSDAGQPGFQHVPHALCFLPSPL